MTKVLTKREALEKCRAQWLWVSEGDLRHKGDYPFSEGDGDVYGDCYACQYSHEQGTFAMMYCGDTCILPWRGGHCEAIGSQYHKWVVAGADGRVADAKAAALSIVDLCDQALREDR